jgi:hypothetical protein
MRPPQELLYDSEASLRLVDHAIEELSASGAELDREARGFLEHVMSQPGGFAELSRTLLRAYAETVGIVIRMRESSGMLDGAGIEKLEQMHGRLNEVSEATETATTGILDGMARAIALTEKFDDITSLSEAERKQMTASLREELSGVVNHLQFQDITSQQLRHIANLLADMRQRISQVVAIFAPAASFQKTDASAPVPIDPAVTELIGGDLQAVADEIFAIRTERKTA